jgi:glutamyl-Q tRNA(Asp) synthetase
VIFRTRFAPSPTGPLHLGHAYSALLAHDMARTAGGQFLLRIEDIDNTRSRPEWEAQIYNDLRWLGLTWDAPPMCQSDRLDVYQGALDRLWSMGLLYLCTCTRRDIDTALSAPQEGVDIAYGPDGPVYPGTCRRQSVGTGERPNGVLRLNMQAAMDHLPPTIRFTETGMGPHGEIGDCAYTDPARTLGDIVLSRKDFLGSYHLSVVLDDAAQAITHVVRGLDLFEATKIHVILQHLLGLPTPRYHHHRLIRDDHGKRLAKRDDARAIATYRAEGVTPSQIRAMVGLL